MSILVDQNTKIICQGSFKSKDVYYIKQCIEHGTHIAALVLPNKNHSLQTTLPVFTQVKEAVKETQANTAVISLPPSQCKDIIIESLEANLKLIVCLTSNVPRHDMLQIKSFLKFFDAYLIGPNSPGIISPGKGKIGFIAVDIHQMGDIGIVSRSRTLMYELTAQMTQLGFGQSTCIGIGSDAIAGTSFYRIFFV